jgi:hypothetical protein
VKSLEGGDIDEPHDDDGRNGIFLARPVIG